MGESKRGDGLLLMCGWVLAIQLFEDAATETGECFDCWCFWVLSLYN